MRPDPERTTLYLRGMPRRLVREAKATAARRGTTLADVVSDALAKTLDSTPTETGTDMLAVEMAWYDRNKSKLERRYNDEYVAIVGGAVVDHDPDFSSLAERVFRKHGERSVFMPRIGQDTRLHIRSPRIRR